MTLLQYQPCRARYSCFGDIRFSHLHLDRAVGLTSGSRRLFLVALPALGRAAVMPDHEHQIARGHLGRPNHGRARHACEAATKAARKAERAEAYAWSVQMEATADPRSRRQRSGSASTADSAGSKSYAIAVRPAPACRSMRFVGHWIHRSGSYALKCR